MHTARDERTPYTHAAFFELGINIIIPLAGRIINAKSHRHHRTALRVYNSRHSHTWRVGQRWKFENLMPALIIGLDESGSGDLAVCVAPFIQHRTRYWFKKRLFAFVYRSTKVAENRENNKTLPCCPSLEFLPAKWRAKNVDSESDVPKSNHAFGCYCRARVLYVHWLFFTVRLLIGGWDPPHAYFSSYGHWNI